MKGNIIKYGVETRDHMINFHNKFYTSYGSNAFRDDRMTPQNLGRNWSCFLYERAGKNYMCMFDSDDGSGGTPADCKLIWSKFHEITTQHGVQDYIVFKIQHTPISEHRQFYPFKRDVYPLALMTNEPDRVFKLADNMVAKEQDIDVLFVGGKVHDHNNPYCWPKHRNTNQHWPTNRKIGYGKLLEIKERRKDLNIVAVDRLLQHGDYYDLVNRTKICLDFPGIGVSSRKFYEFLALGKCVLALRQNNCCWPLEENVHYASLGVDFDYTSLESRIDQLLADPQLRSRVGSNAASLRPYMSFDAVGRYVIDTLDAFVDKCEDGTIESFRTRYD